MDNFRWKILPAFSPEQSRHLIKAIAVLECWSVAVKSTTHFKWFELIIFFFFVAFSLSWKAKLCVTNYKPLTAEIRPNHRKIRSQKKNFSFSGCIQPTQLRGIRMNELILLLFCNTGSNNSPCRAESEGQHRQHWALQAATAICENPVEPQNLQIFLWRAANPPWAACRYCGPLAHKYQESEQLWVAARKGFCRHRQSPDTAPNYWQLHLPLTPPWIQGKQNTWPT